MLLTKQKYNILCSYICKVFKRIVLCNVQRRIVCITFDAASHYSIFVIEILSFSLLDITFIEDFFENIYENVANK